jgi:hypothetical protein
MPVHTKSILGWQQAQAYHHTGHVISAENQWQPDDMCFLVIPSFSVTSPPLMDKCYDNLFASK